MISIRVEILNVKILFILLLMVFSQILFAQKNNPVIEHIRWIRQIPQQKELEQTKKITEIIGDFFFGKEIPDLKRPISLYAKNPDTCWILDQGNGGIYYNINVLGDIPQLVKPKEFSFLSLVGICEYKNDNILFTDSKYGKVFIYNTQNFKIVNFNNAQYNQPTGIAYSPLNHTIWIVETGAHKISVFNEKGEFIKSIGKRGKEPGEFNYPTFIWIDASGKVYIVDSMNFRVQILDSLGEVINTFGELGDATGYFARPKGIATDSYGNIYVVDALYHVVQIFDQKGNFLHYFGSQGQERGKFWMPAGIYIDHNNYIYVADSYNSRIQIFQLINEN